ncbi:unnamed protein product, partial [Adineta steineri]
LSLFPFAANYIPSGVKDISNSIVFTTFLNRSQIEYQAINPAPNYTNLYNYLTTMWATLPNWTQQDFAKINPNLPVWIVDADHEEAIFRDQPDTMSSWIPQSGELILPRTSHFAFLQDSDWFTASIARFLVEVNCSQCNSTPTSYSSAPTSSFHFSLYACMYISFLFFFRLI